MPNTSTKTSQIHQQKLAKNIIEKSPSPSKINILRYMTPAWYPWAAPGVLIAIGLFLIVMSYGALIQSKRSGKHISGVPFFGGFFVFLGFIISPIKWLAVLALVDYSYGMFVYSLLSERFKRSKKD